MKPRHHQPAAVREEILTVPMKTILENQNRVTSRGASAQKPDAQRGLGLRCGMPALPALATAPGAYLLTMVRHTNDGEGILRAPADHRRRKTSEEAFALDHQPHRERAAGALPGTGTTEMKNAGVTASLETGEEERRRDASNNASEALVHFLRDWLSRNR
ncbi:hypothetical protein MGN70_007940 [Eutypa lata]|nr:hypothetical protein MGN70_007940 [Eutypa lata]